MKILFFSHKFYPTIGGIESISEMLADHFVKYGHEVHLITTSQQNDTKLFPYNIIRNPGVLQLLKEFSWADVIFENNPCLRLSWPNIVYKKPLLVGLQTWINLKNSPIKLQDRLKFYWLNNATRVVACSNAVRATVFPKAHLISNPYDESKFRIKPQIEKNKDFVFLGRLVSDKGVALAVEAFNKFLERVDAISSKESTLTIIGEGDERAVLEKLVKKYGIEERVVFTGSMRGEELINELNQYRYILVPSVWNEPFGIVALEGMACGCIPIVSDGGGLPDAVGKAGLVFKRGDVENLVACMLSLKENTLLEEQLREEAKNHLITHQSKNVGKSYLTILTSL